MGIVAIGENIIVEAVKKSDGDIIIPESSRTKDQERGKVVSVGQGKRLNDGSIATPWVVAGDIVYFSPFGAQKLKYENKEYLILKESDILALEK